MRLLNQKQEFIRKRKFQKDSKKSSVSFNILQETFNTAAALKGSGEASFIQKFLKASLNSAIKMHNRGFPGGWVHALRSRNNVKSDFALLYTLGWTEKVPSNHKMLEVLFNTVDTKNSEDTTSKDKVVNITQDKRNFLHQEFRTAVALTLPRLDTAKPENHELDMALDPLSVRDLNICNNFCKDRRDILVDSLNESYVLRVSLKNPKSKTKEIHYKIFRDKMLNNSANIPLIDAKGKIFNTFAKLPEKTQKFLRDKFRYPVKRAREEPPVEEAGSEIMQTDTAPEATRTLKRTRTMTRGQARESVRKSGRLAELRDKSSKET
jgi:hypothetical protein